MHFRATEKATDKLKHDKKRIETAAGVAAYCGWWLALRSPTRCHGMPLLRRPHLEKGCLREIPSLSRIRSFVRRSCEGLSIQETAQLRVLWQIAQCCLVLQTNTRVCVSRTASGRVTQNRLLSGTALIPRMQTSWARQHTVTQAHRLGITSTHRTGTSHRRALTPLRTGSVVPRPWRYPVPPKLTKKERKKKAKGFPQTSQQTNRIETAAGVAAFRARWLLR